MAIADNTATTPAGATPPPPVPPDCDVSALPGFMLDTVRLLGSELWALSSGDEFKAAVALWCRAWHQVPAGSLPDDDAVLCSFAGYGRDAKGWRKVRVMALRGFMRCDDGRLYHPVLSADAVQAFQRRQAFQKKRETDAERLRQWRTSQSETPVKRVSSRKDRDRDRDINPLTPVVATTDELVWRNRLSGGPSGPWLFILGAATERTGLPGPGGADCRQSVGYPGEGCRMTTTRRAFLAGTAAAAATVVPAIALATAAPTGDDAIVAAFQRWLDLETAINLAADKRDNDAFEEACESALAAHYEVMEIPAEGLVGLAIQSYMVLSNELAPGNFYDHGCAVRIKDIEDVGEIPVRVSAGLFASLCNIIPDFRRISTAKRGETVRLNLSRRASA